MTADEDPKAADVSEKWPIIPKTARLIIDHYTVQFIPHNSVVRPLFQKYISIDLWDMEKLLVVDDQRKYKWHQIVNPGLLNNELHQDGPYNLPQQIYTDHQLLEFSRIRSLEVKCCAIKVNFMWVIPYDSKRSESVIIKLNPLWSRVIIHRLFDSPG